MAGRETKASAIKTSRSQVNTPEFPVHAGRGKSVWQTTQSSFFWTALSSPVLPGDGTKIWCGGVLALYKATQE